jgi:lipoprotein-releasing system permease protein
VFGSLMAQDLVAGLEKLLHIQFLNAEIYPVSYLPSQMRLADFVLVGCVSLVMSLLATLYPAWKASRVAPAEALRFE